LLVTAFALALPASTFAVNGYNTIIKLNRCDGFAGNGWSAVTISLKVRVVAKAGTAADTIEIDSEAQRKSVNNGWVTYESWPTATHTYVPDGTDHSLSLRRDFTTPTSDQQYGNQAFRIVFQIRALAGSTTEYATIVRKKCL
jgi:hypothetical protein